MTISNSTQNSSSASKKIVGKTDFFFSWTDWWLVILTVRETERISSCLTSTTLPSNSIPSMIERKFSWNSLFDDRIPFINNESSIKILLLNGRIPYRYSWQPSYITFIAVLFYTLKKNSTDYDKKKLRHWRVIKEEINTSSNLHTIYINRVLFPHFRTSVNNTHFIP